MRKILATIGVLLVCSLGFMGCAQSKPAESVGPYAAQTSEDVVPYGISTSEITSLFQESGDYTLSMKSMAQIEDIIWSTPTHLIVEVPAEIWSNGTIKWQQVIIDWSQGAQKPFTYVTINTSNGAMSLSYSGRLSLAEIAGMTALQLSDYLDINASMPHVGRIWAGNN